MPAVAPFAGDHGQWGADADRLGEGHGDVQHIRDGHDPVDEAPAQRISGTDRLPGEGCLHGDFGRQLTRQHYETAGGSEQAPCHLGEAKRGLVAHDREIAPQDDLRPATEGDTVDCGDHGFAHLVVYEPSEPPLGVARRHQVFTRAQRF